MNTKTKSMTFAALIFGVLLTPVAFNQAAEAMVNVSNQAIGVATPDTFFLRGDLTAPAGDAPFGGENVGKYLLKANGNDIRIFTAFDSSPSDGMVYEGWLVDMATGYKLSLGQFDDRNHLHFSQTIVNPWIYDVLVITAEPIEDTDPAPHMPVGGNLLQEPFGQA